MGFEVAKNLARIKNEIAEARGKFGSDSDSVVIVGVTKYFGPEGIIAAVCGGVTNIGENRPLDVKTKFPAANEELKKLFGDGKFFKRHMIGHLQRNKVKVALEYFDLIQSLDSIRLAEEIELQAEKKGIEKVDCLLEVKVSEEESKTGINAQDVYHQLLPMLSLERINIQGIMGMAPFVTDPEATRPYFVRLREIFDRLKADETDGFQMKYLSMGMSHDFQIAVEEGANMVRIGQALFE